jgi:hypothetical protein
MSCGPLVAVGGWKSCEKSLNRKVAILLRKLIAGFLLSSEQNSYLSSSYQLPTLRYIFKTCAKVAKANFLIETIAGPIDSRTEATQQ